MMTYSAHVEGFEGKFETVESLRLWAEDLNSRFNLKGKVLQIWKVEYRRDKLGRLYPTYGYKPARELVIGA